MGKRVKDQQCPVCSVMLSHQGMIGHLRYKHPNYDAQERKQPKAVQDIEQWKEGFREGVLAAVKKAG